MPSNKKLLQAAAGSAGSDPLYVEDVFSTYLYTGTGSALVINNGIALGDTNYGASVEFNGTSDSLTRASDFSGNADGNSFTFSCWCFKAVDGVTLRIFTNGQSSGTDSGLVVYAGNNALVFIARDASDVTIFSAYAYTNILPLNVWTNVLISVDLSSASNRYIYMNDVDVTSSFTFSQYTNGNINFTTTTQNIGKADGISSQLWQGKLSSLFLDYTYRDLSVTSNRRLFITADGQPAANQASLNPIMFMPLDDTNAIGKNLGTGGDFTANGPPTALSQGGPYIEAGYGEGGLVWSKDRDTTARHSLINTATPTEFLSSNTTDASGAGINLSANSNGYSLDSYDFYNIINVASNDYVSWTFRKAEKFFDFVTYTGDGVAGRTVAHNLGSVPAVMFIKRTSASGDDWAVYHSALGATKLIALNTTSASLTNPWLTDTAPTDSVFTLNNYGFINDSGSSYIAYLFASDAGGFGEDETENIIKCGSYTGSGAAGNDVSLGWEPQYLLVKQTTASGNGWFLFDSMRGVPTGGADAILFAEDSRAELSSERLSFTASGFTLDTTASSTNGSGQTYIYIAIRRPMKTPTAGTEVFALENGNGGGSSTVPEFAAPFASDLFYMQNRNGGGLNYNGSRLAGNSYLQFNGTAAEASGLLRWDSMNGMYFYSTTDYTGYMFKRATGFMDVVAYTGNFSTSATQAHNLGVVPELILVKGRSQAYDWQGYSEPTGKGKVLWVDKNYQATDSLVTWNNTSPTASVFTVGQTADVNALNQTFIAYLFASVSGVSKVGSYTGTGANVNVDCGFTAGARWIMIKRTDSTGDWYVYDSARGISAGNDPYLFLNTTAAQVTNTDYIDPLSSGFTVTSNASSTVNVNGGTYLFLAIA
jgi:hypothetical protein